jgi:drug/metabolite transporter (DMT)-like permease
MNLLPSRPTDRVATGVLLFSASLWGLSWWPLKGFIDQGLSGPVVSLFTYGTVAILAIGLLWRDRSAWRAQWGLVLALTLVGGWANTSFVNALMLGDVVRVMFLFYLSPVWSVLGGWLFLKERIPPTRWLAVAAAIVGLWMVLGGPGLGDSGALGFTWVDANNVIARAAHRVPLRTKTFCIFIGCGLFSALATGLSGQGVPAVSTGLLVALLAYGFGWLLLATVTWQYGVSHLESSRAGLILLAELLVSVGTAIAFGGESLTPLGWAGGALIATAAGVEALGGTPAQATPNRTADTTA